jgi:hypothetical protein
MQPICIGSPGAMYCHSTLHIRRQARIRTRRPLANESTNADCNLWHRHRRPDTERSFATATLGPVSRSSSYVEALLDAQSLHHQADADSR